MTVTGDGLEVDLALAEETRPPLTRVLAERGSGAPVNMRGMKYAPAPRAVPAPAYAAVVTGADR